MKKIISTLLSVVAIYVFINLVGLINNVHATLPCPGGVCPACSYGCSCSPCSGGTSCGLDALGHRTACPICGAPSCGGDSEGACPGGCSGGCSESTATCPCGNSTKTCHHCTGPTDTPAPTPTPSNTPTPTPSPTPTPTPIQPTVVMPLTLPQTNSFSDDRKSKRGQSWICIQTIPCSQTGITCSGGNPQHRIIIQTKEGTTLKMNSAPTYVFECISPDQNSYRCTTGNNGLDQTLISKSNLSGLAADYGYQFISYTNTQNVPIDQTNINNVPKTTDKGAFGPYEWESKTSIQIWRLIMTMQDLDWTSGTQGNAGALQQATFSFGHDDYNKDCVIIKWDPQGVIYDVASLHPMDGVKVTLYVKNTQGTFVPMQDKKWGLLANPVISSQHGDYQFLVPAGTYKIEVEKQGYELVTDKNSISSIKTIKNIYGGGEITTSGDIQEINILMRKKTIFHTIIETIESLFIHGK